MVYPKNWLGLAKLAAAGTLAAAVAAPAAAGSWQQNVALGGFSKVHIYTPDSLSLTGNGKKALMLVLHGCVQPINNFLTANLEDAAEASGTVIAVPDAKNKAGNSCWSYWMGSKSRTAGDYKNLIGLANAMSGDASRNIDPDQVYIAGLSSGGAFAAQAACVAPDVFKGLAISAGPTIGSGSGGAIRSCSGVVSPSTYKSRCESYAGSYKSHLNTQITVTAHAPNDSIVYDCYNEANGDGFAHIYGANKLPGTTTISESGAQSATEALYSDGDVNRVSLLWLPSAVDHAWSGGQGASGSYISGAGINFGTYLGTYFAENNPLISRNEAPVLSGVAASDSSDRLVVSGTATDAEGSVSGVTISISNMDSGSPVLVETINTTVNGSNQFNVTSGSLANALYSVSVVATDNEGSDSDPTIVTERVGPEPPASAPVLSNLSAAVNAQCATVTGTVVDANQNLDTVSVAFGNGSVAATINGTSFSAQKCSLAGGAQSATATATDTGGLNSSASVSFTIDAGSTGDYNFHIGEGHIDWGYGYAECYLAFGTGQFTMREVSAGSQCQWVADGSSSCKGPTQACSGGSTGPIDTDGDGIIDSADNCPVNANSDQADNDNDGLGNVCDSTPNGGNTGGNCEDVTAANYYHKTGGRAYSTGSYWTPDYFANGSNDAMAGSTWGSTTLKSTDGGTVWNVGSCP